MGGFRTLLTSTSGALLFAVACSSTYGEEGGTTPGGGDGGAAESAADSGAPLDVPDGWSLVVVASTCPEGFSNPREYVDNPRAPATACTCSCAPPTANPCTTGSTLVNVRNGGANCNDVQFTATTDGACHAIGVNTQQWNAVSFSARPPGQVTCAASASAPPALIDDGKVTICGVNGGGTPASLPFGTAACVVRSGTDPCPTGWPSRRVLVAADEITDERACTGCTCTGSATCASPQLHFFGDENCTALDLGPVAATATCNAFLATGTRTVYRYEAQANITCTPAAPSIAPTGELKLGERETMCCR